MKQPLLSFGLLLFGVCTGYAVCTSSTCDRVYNPFTRNVDFVGGVGASSLAVTDNLVHISSPTAVLNFNGPQFVVTQPATSTATVTLNSSSVTLQGNNLSATYLTNSSATVTYCNANGTNCTSGGSTTLISSGVAFGSASNTVTQDTNTFVYDGTNYALHIGTNPFNSSYVAMSGPGLRLWARSAIDTPLAVANPYNTEYLAFASNIGPGFNLGFPSVDVFRIYHSPSVVRFKAYDTNGGDGSFTFDGGSGSSWLTASSSSQTVKGPFQVNNLTASQFVQTNSSKVLVSYDLFNSSPTFTSVVTVSSFAVTSGGSVGKTICWKSATTFGYCSSVVGVGGDCTCN